MSLLDPEFDSAASHPVGDWHPARYTPPLGPNWTSAGDRLLSVIARRWSIAGVREFGLDEWGVWLIRAILETYPPDWPDPQLRGRLRYRQVIVSMGRQNGKSVVAALLVLWMLTLHVRAARVAGFASIDRQARIIYDRVKYAIDQCPEFSREIRTTDTRGISMRHRPSTYDTYPAKEDSLQGEPFTGVLYDELHLGDQGIWDAVVLAQRAQPHGIIVGFTTAGDDDSALLHQLYRLAEHAIAEPGGRFGAFIWEAADDTLTEANVIAANPGIAAGRIDLDTTMAEARTMMTAPANSDGVTGADRVVRYTLNRHVAGSATAWVALSSWTGSATREWEPPGTPADTVYAIDRTPTQEWASITETTHRAGTTVTRLIASIPAATNDLLQAICTDLARKPASRLALPRDQLGKLAEVLNAAGISVDVLGAERMADAARTAQAAISRRAVRHPGDPLTRSQMPHAKRRTAGETWHLSPTLSTGDIDAVRATVIGIYVASTTPPPHRQIF